MARAGMAALWGRLWAFAIAAGRGLVKSQTADRQDGIYREARASFVERRDPIRAKQLCEDILRRDPDHFLALQLSGAIAHEHGRFDEAEGYYLKAGRIKGDDAPLHSNHGNALQALQRFDEALASYDRAISIKPDFASAFNNRGNVLHKMKRLDEALASYDQAIALAPEFADALYNRGQLLLLLGRFMEGWRSAEWRKRTSKDRRGNRSFAVPLWSGDETLSGKTIFVHHEQGLGDVIQFCRYIPLLAKMGATVLFAPQKPLQRLASGLSHACQIVDVEDGSLRFDFHCPVLSLPLAFETTLETIPNGVPYLAAEPDRTSRWKARIGDDGFKIGICWQAKSDTGRSFPLRQFEGLSRVPGVRLISLHKGKGEAQLRELPQGMVIETFGEELDSGPDAFIDTAAVMKCCDLIITSDTSIAHLAGSLGAKTWVALKFVPDWRWMLDREDSPWYPTLRLFRQKADGDWKGVFERIETALLQEIKRRK